MTRVLEQLQPNDIFYYFEEISNIPRGSGNEKAISDYMVEFAKKHNLWVKQDEANNIYIKKPATPGYENVPTVILQGHLDMVCEKNKNTEHDFEKDGLNLVIDGDFVKAKGTTLGADNGIAIAYQMAILADDTLEHPAIEALMTTDEETGMHGVANLHPEYLDGKVLLNLDTDEEGEFLVSCAGGMRTYTSLKLSSMAAPEGFVPYTLTIKNLNGGHSGADIHLERANANIVLGRVLDLLRKEIDFYLVDFTGGSKDNVITREAEATICLEKSALSKLEAFAKDTEKLLKQEYAAQDANITLLLSAENVVSAVLTKEVTNKIIDMVILLPYGVAGYSRQIPGLVETSSNLGVIKIENDVITFVVSIRSSMPSKKEALAHKIEALAKVMGAEFKSSGDYPAWVYEENSKIRELAGTLYKEMYGKEASIKAIHAGLECGFILEKLPGVDMISFGPNVYDIHSPEERMSISSMGRVYGYLTELLKNMNRY